MFNNRNHQNRRTYRQSYNSLEGSEDIDLSEGQEYDRDQEFTVEAEEIKRSEIDRKVQNKMKVSIPNIEV